jgi:TrmH family RNA methyltransferase
MNPALCVVLVGPEQAANVGFAARTMACYALSNLRIVGSPGIAADGAARKTGKAAPEVLDGARYFPSLQAAVADCGAVYGFTRRARDPSQRIDDLGPAARAWRQGNVPGTSALVLGRESQGLFREETLLLTHLVRIPLQSGTLSLNVSHALAIGLYAFLTESAGTDGGTAAGFGGAGGMGAAETGGTGGAASLGYPTRSETAGALEGLLTALEGRGFFKGGKEDAQKEYVRLLWQRMNPGKREFDFLAGMLRALSAYKES